jgi:hypothetical protein
MLQKIIGKIPGLKQLQKVLNGVGKFVGSIGKRISKSLKSFND